MDCARCAQTNPDTARFCMSCGAAMPGTSREERKLVTVVFIDLVGFTRRAEQLDVEDLRATLRSYFALVRRELERYGGTVEKFVGDAVVAVFGAPDVHEDDPERGVRASFALRDAIAASNARHDSDLHVRIGVNTGEAVVSLDARDGEGMVTGDAINVASRLQTAAPVDGILVGEVTHRATERSVVYGPRQEVIVKGKTRPVIAYQALGAMSRVAVARHDRATPALVGRRSQLQELLCAFEESQAHQRLALVSLVGPPGIGKSRLVWELFRLLEQRPELIRWRLGRSLAYGEGVTFVALAEAVKAEAGILDTDGAETSSLKLTNAVRALVSADEAEWLVRHLRSLVGLTLESELYGDRRAEAFAAWRRFLEAMAGRSGLVLVLEDLHWADDALLDFIENLVAWSSGYPLLLVCTARDELLEQRAGWGRLPGSTVIDLQPLSDQQTTALLEAVGGIGLSDETRRALVAAAAGNPLYAQEFLRLLVDRGLLHREGDRWHLEPGGEIPVPDSIVAIVAARIDGLPVQDKAVLQNAAVVGEVHWPGAVAMVASRGRWAVEEAMSRLERRQLLRRRPDSSVAGEAEYMFEHSLVRDVAYGSILRIERAQRHLRAADWLESLPGDRSGRAETLVHHLLIGLEGAVSTPRDDVLERAVEALDTAGHRALALHSYPAAARFFTQAIDLAPSTAARRGHWLLGRGLALAMAGVPAHAALDQAAEQLVSDGDHKRAAEAISTMAWLDALAGRMDAARGHDDRALALSEGPPATAADALVLTRAGTHRVFSTATRSAGLELLARALAVARDQHLRDIEAEALQFTGMGRIGGGDIAGVADVERALEIALDVGSPVQLSVYGNLADIRKRMADLRESERLHLAGLAAARQFGVPVQVRRFEAEQTAHLYWKGDWDSALARADAYLEAVETGSPHEMEAEVRVLRGRIRHARGDAEGARSDADRAVRFARQTGHPYDLFPALAFAGRLGGQAEIEELLARLETEDPFWVAWALPDAVAAALSFGTEAALRSVLERASPSTPWYEAALLCLEQSLVRAAGIYQRIGALPEEAEVWELLPATSLDPLVGAGKGRAERFLEAVGVAARESRPTIGM